MTLKATIDLNADMGEAFAPMDHRRWRRRADRAADHLVQYRHH